VSKYLTDGDLASLSRDEYGKKKVAQSYETKTIEYKRANREFAIDTNRSSLIPRSGRLSDFLRDFERFPPAITDRSFGSDPVI